MKNLIPMSDYVIDSRMFITNNYITESDLLAQIFLYAKFLKQPLELWMFVPCDEEGNVMKEPYMVFADDNEECEDYIKLFCEAKERVLFEGFSTSYQEETNDTFGFYTLFKNGRIFIKFQKTDQLFVHPDNIVENLTKHNISLTPTALKQLCLNH